MKKILAILIMAIFLISIVPMAIAEEDDDDQNEIESDDDEIETEDDEDEIESETEIESEDGTRLKIKERIRAGENLKEIRLESKNDLLEVKTRLRECKNDGSEDCKKVRTEAKVKVSGGLGNAVDRMIAAVEKLKARLEESDVEAKAELIARLDARLASLNELKAKIAELGVDATPQEVREAAKELKSSWNDGKKEAKKAALKRGEHGLNGVLQRIEKLKTKLQTTIDRLSEKGLDTAAAEANLTLFNGFVANAQAKADAAKPLLETDESDPNFESAIKQGHQLLKEARDELRKAHEALKETIKSIKATEAGEVELEAEVDEEGEEE